MTPVSIPRTVLVLALLALPALASAHDFLLWPGDVEHDALALRLLVHDGHALGDERGFRREHVSRFFAEDAHGQRELEGREEGAPPFAQVSGLVPGGHWLAVDRVAIDIELAPQVFNGYLDHEGLDAALAERQRRGEGDAPGRERYARHLKAFVQVGAEGDGVGCRRLRQELEVVFHDDPARFAVGRTVEVELLELGSPVADHPLDIWVEGDPDVHAHRVRTDGRGRARVTLRRPGRTVFRTVSMKRCEGCDAVDWTSRWTAATVDVAPMGSGAPRACPQG